MTVKFIAASATALMALCGTAEAGKITQLSASIILLGEPAPAEALPAEKAQYRKVPDVLAAGERREAGIAYRAPELPVAEDETTAAIDDASDDGGATPPPFPPLEDAQLRQ